MLYRWSQFKSAVGAVGVGGVGFLLLSQAANAGIRDHLSYRTVDGAEVDLEAIAHTINVVPGQVVNLSASWQDVNSVPLDDTNVEELTFGTDTGQQCVAASDNCDGVFQLNDYGVTVTVPWDIGASMTVTVSSTTYDSGSESGGESGSDNASDGEKSPRAKTSSDNIIFNKSQISLPRLRPSPVKTTTV